MAREARSEEHTSELGLEVRRGLFRSVLDFFAARTDLFQYTLDAKLVDNTHALGGHTQAHKALLGLNPETMVVQIRLETTLGLDVRVRNSIARYRALTGHLANLGHCLAP